MNNRCLCEFLGHHPLPEVPSLYRVHTYGVWYSYLNAPCLHTLTTSATTVMPNKRTVPIVNMFVVSIVTATYSVSFSELNLADECFFKLWAFVFVLEPLAKNFRNILRKKSVMEISDQEHLWTNNIHPWSRWATVTEDCPRWYSCVVLKANLCKLLLLLLHYRSQFKSPCSYVSQ